MLFTIPTWRLATVYLTLAAVAGTSCSSRAEARDVISNRSKPVQVQAAAGMGTKTGKKKIKIALLLDTSNSMDGLIDQAKSQLWKLVNALADARCGDNEKPMLEIALYEYGNDNLSAKSGYIRRIAMFTNDLDLISEKLFALSTHGGEEYCGEVIQTATNQLEWTGGDNDLRIIFIAGNEPFSQGSVNYTDACKDARKKDIVVNTIYCGGFDEGLSTGWKNGAMLTDGSYMSIEQDRKTVYIETPYDKQIAALNSQLNDTYISYGREGRIKKDNQSAQDNNASSYGLSNMSERVMSKTSSLYSNSSWDLVDASNEKDFDVTKIKETDLPKELQGKTKDEKLTYIRVKNKEREMIKTQLLDVNKTRVSYISGKEKEAGSDTQSLDAAMLKAIREQAVKKNFSFEAN